MKYLILITLTISLLFITLSCTKPNVKVKDTEYRIPGVVNTIKIIEIDSCEYLYGDWGNATVLTHKGNCKYCIARSKSRSK